jgi:hypothetical protein
MLQWRNEDYMLTVDKTDEIPRAGPSDANTRPPVETSGGVLGAP